MEPLSKEKSVGVPMWENKRTNWEEKSRGYGNRLWKRSQWDTGLWGRLFSLACGQS